MFEFLNDECDPVTCTTGIHIDIDSGKTLNICPICKVNHNDADGSYRIIAMSLNGAECILQEDQFKTAKFVFNKDINHKPIFNNDTWIKHEDKNAPINELIITKDKANGDIYMGKVKDNGWFDGKHIDMGSFMLGPIDHFVWKAIEK